jgi:hypothetical protein
MRATQNAAPIERFAGRADVAAEQYGDEVGRIEQAATDAAAELGLEDVTL